MSATVWVAFWQNGTTWCESPLMRTKDQAIRAAKDARAVARRRTAFVSSWGPTGRHLRFIVGPKRIRKFNPYARTR